MLLKRTEQKPGVQMGKLDPALDTAGLVAVAEFHRVMGDSYRPTITSANDFAWHVRFSKHYYNRALDFRLFDVPPGKTLRVGPFDSPQAGKPLPRPVGKRR